jgi:hypothetical protein
MIMTPSPRLADHVQRTPVQEIIRGVRLLVIVAKMSILGVFTLDLFKFVASRGDKELMLRAAKNG